MTEQLQQQPRTGHFEPCEECGAPLDPQQRYCVNCAARRGNGANPASRYFATMSKRARRPTAKPAVKAGSSSRAAAVGFFALLPIAVALGVVVGRGGSTNNDQALLDALRNQNAIAGSSAATTATAAIKQKGKAQKGAAAAKDGGKVVAKTPYGSVHQVTGYKPSKQQVTHDTGLVQQNVKQTGKDYVNAQKSLPDVIVVGGDPNAAPALPTGKGQP